MGNLVGTIAGGAAKATPWGAIATGVGALAGLVKMGIGASQIAKYTKRFNQGLANRPLYQIPKEYQDVLTTYQKLSQGKMPGFDTELSQIGQTTAQSTQAAERGAISSNAYMDAVNKLNQQALTFQQNLGIRNEQYQSGMTEKALGAELGLGEQKAQQWNINEYGKWQTMMNFYGEKAGVASQNLWGGINDISGTLANFAGTKAYLDVLERLSQKETSTEDLNKYRVDINNPVT
jgi:hypothetical protein